MKLCKMCNTPLKERHDREVRFCSKACYIAHSQSHKTIAKCPTCGNEFLVNNNATYVKQYCSSKCSHSKPLSEEFYKARATAIHAPIRTHPKVGKFETNCNAKEWLIMSPDGETINCRNLKLYMIQKFGEEEGRKMAIGITKAVVRYKKHGHGEYKGWILLALPATIK